MLFMFQDKYSPCYLQNQMPFLNNKRKLKKLVCCVLFCFFVFFCTADIFVLYFSVDQLYVDGLLLNKKKPLKPTSSR